MRKLVDSDIFSDYLNRGNATTGKITKILIVLELTALY
jgi:hypothetical protein